MTLRKKLTWIAVLYFGSGFPYGIAYDVWPVYFRVHGVSLKDIGLMALLFLPYTLKPAWAPLVDRLGSRQSWIAVCQLGLAVGCLAMLALDPADTSWRLWLVLLVFTTLAATQDISIDAYAVDVSTPADSGHINGMRVSLYRAALLFAGGVLLVIADVEGLGWRALWVISAGLLVALAALTWMSPRAPREPRSAEPTAAAPLAGPLDAWRGGLVAATVLAGFFAWRAGWSGTWLGITVVVAAVALGSFLSPELLRWLFRPEMLPVVGFVILYKVGDSALGRMVKPFWVDRGMTPGEIGIFSSGIGMALTIAGALLGGLYVSRYGIFSALLWMGIAQLVSNFGYVAVAVLGLPRGETSLFGLTLGPFQASLYTASVIESITQGLGTAAFLSLLMNLCDRRSSATQYALLSALFAFSRDVTGAFSGIGVERYGYPIYFTVTAALALPGLLLLPWVKSQIREKESPAPSPHEGGRGSG